MRHTWYKRLGASLVVGMLLTGCATRDNEAPEEENAPLNEEQEEMEDENMEDEKEDMGRDDVDKEEADDAEMDDNQKEEENAEKDGEMDDDNE